MTRPLPIRPWAVAVSAAPRGAMRLGVLALAALASAAPPAARAQQHEHAGHAASPAAPAGSNRITMEQLHAAGGVPPGWRFSLPAGDPAAGRKAFVDFKCFACHAVKGERFPLEPGQVASAGPELSGMGSLHPTEYLVESIVNPNAVLVDGPGFIGGDGRSIMPTFPQMTLTQLADLVAYLKSRPGDAAHEAERPREQTAGGYRVRLAFVPAAASAEHAGHEHQHPAASAPPSGKGRLVAFVLDSASGQAIPYAPVTARLESPGKPARTVKLSPAIGAEGFHYGAELTLPGTTRKIAITVGPPALLSTAGAPAQLRHSQTVVFDWK